MSMFSFDVEARAPGCRARAGVIHTPHGVIHTPAFAPVGTKASVKGVLPTMLEALGAEVVLANTYHLYLQPGEKIVQDAGGLGAFMGWSGPTMTDSGGYQVFSLGAAFGKKISKFTCEDFQDIGCPSSDEGHPMSKHVLANFDPDVASQHGQLAVIDDEGVTFTSHLDGSLHRFTPERSIEIQHALGADMFFAFDECTSPTEPYDYQREAMERTHRWAERSLRAHKMMEYEKMKASLPAEASSRRQAIFGIVQGGRHEDLRAESARAIAGMGFDGIGIGGSFSKEDMQGALQAAVSKLPGELPRHFLGIGEPGDMLEGIANGMDLFDCVAATRLGRHGSIYTRYGLVHLKNGQYGSDFTPLQDVGTFNVPTSVNKEFTLAYVSHLLRSGEMLGATIASMHNLHFILNLVAGARQAIFDGRFDAYREDFMHNYYHG